jgi:NADPH-dependent curcumin reductase CurA
MNKQIKLARRAIGLPDAETWRLEHNTIPEPADGEVLIKQHYISLDPAMRGWINDVRSYIKPVALDDVMRAGSVGEIIESNKHPFLKKGMYVQGTGGVQQYLTTDGKGWFPIDNTIAPLTRYLSTLGMPGMTAYFGILEVGKINEGDVVLVSGAAGAVGSVVGQIAKVKKCKVIGIAGGKEKCDYLLNDLGFDGAIDYKNENVKEKIAYHCPKGIDVYFDNVGGEILDAALVYLRRNARIVICGAISQYNVTEKIKGPSNYLSLLINRASMTGMVVFDYADRYKDAALEMSQWIADGKLKSKEDIYEGIESFHTTFLRLFSGEKLGKLVLKISD